MRFLLQFHQPLIYTLLGAALVTWIFKEVVYAAVGLEKSIVARWSSHAT